MGNDIDKCKCGKAQIEYEVMGEDLYSATLQNSTIKKDGFGKKVFCKSCKEGYSTFDPCMVKLFTYTK